MVYTHKPLMVTAEGEAGGSESSSIHNSDGSNTSCIAVWKDQHKSIIMTSHVPSSMGKVVIIALQSEEESHRNSSQLELEGT